MGNSQVFLEYQLDPREFLGLQILLTNLIINLEILTLFKHFLVGTKINQFLVFLFQIFFLFVKRMNLILQSFYLVIFDRELISKAFDLVGEVEILAEGVIRGIEGVIIIEGVEFSEEFDLFFDVFEGMTGFLHGII